MTCEHQHAMGPQKLASAFTVLEVLTGMLGVALCNLPMGSSPDP